MKEFFQKNILVLLKMFVTGYQRKKHAGLRQFYDKKKMYFHFLKTFCQNTHRAVTDFSFILLLVCVCHFKDYKAIHTICSGLWE